MSILSLRDVAILKALSSGAKNIKELQTELFVFRASKAEICMRVMHLEQAKLILGNGLPKEYGILKNGELALEEFKSQAKTIME